MALKSVDRLTAFVIKYDFQVDGLTWHISTDWCSSSLLNTSDNFKQIKILQEENFDFISANNGCCKYVKTKYE